MSLNKLLKVPLSIFKKDSISFVIIRRHDLEAQNENLSYISVRPNSSFADLRFKLWRLLNLPDFCDEVVMLKTCEGVDVPLKTLRRGNTNPRKPFILEVWLPEQLEALNSDTSRMLTIEDTKTSTEVPISESKLLHRGDFERKKESDYEPIALKRHTIDNRRTMLNLIQSEYETNELSSKMSRSSIFVKLHARKSKENLLNMLLKIQTDLSVLSNKIGCLENRIDH